LLGHLCTFPWGLEICFKVWPYLFNSSLQFEVLLLCLSSGELTNYKELALTKAHLTVLLPGSCISSSTWGLI
jgi:hypothetical protein